MGKENPFDIVMRLFKEDNVSVKHGFMVNKILSYQPMAILASIKINKYIGRLPRWATDSLFNLCVKKQGLNNYLQYIKKVKEENLKLNQKICQTLCCNTYQAKQIINIIRKLGKKPEQYFGLKKGE